MSTSNFPAIGSTIQKYVDGTWQDYVVTTHSPEKNAFEARAVSGSTLWSHMDGEDKQEFLYLQGWRRTPSSDPRLVKKGDRFYPVTSSRVLAYDCGAWVEATVGRHDTSDGTFRLQFNGTEIWGWNSRQDKAMSGGWKFPDTSTGADVQQQRTYTSIKFRKAPGARSTVHVTARDANCKATLALGIDDLKQMLAAIEPAPADAPWTNL